MVLPSSVVSVTDDFLCEVDARFPGRVTGLFLHGSLGWGEFFLGSDIDFVVVWKVLPQEQDLAELSAAHEAVKGRHPDRVFDGSHVTAGDLATDTTVIDSRPVFYQGAFDPSGRIDLNPVTWHELASRAVVVRGKVPDVHTDLGQLLAFTRNNLDTYWRGALDQIADVGGDAVGQHDYSVEWCGLGAARLHYLLNRRALTSKSGAGRYVRDDLDDRWNLLARECLRLRETPEAPSLYDDLGNRGRDLQTPAHMAHRRRHSLTPPSQDRNSQHAVLLDGRLTGRPSAARLRNDRL